MSGSFVETVIAVLRFLKGLRILTNSTHSGCMFDHDITQSQSSKKDNYTTQVMTLLRLL